MIRKIFGYLFFTLSLLPLWALAFGILACTWNAIRWNSNSFPAMWKELTELLADWWNDKAEF